MISLLYLMLCVRSGISAENLKSYDPTAYYVNNVEDLDVNVYEAYLQYLDGNFAKKAELANQGRSNFDIFICINENFHAFVLCVPAGNDPKGPFSDMLRTDPLLIPEQTLCWTFELGFQHMELKIYKIRKNFKSFKYLQRSTKTFYIGRYEGVSPNSLEFAALGASPHQYNVLINDCVEFAKEFCIQLLSYSTNGKELEEKVQDKIREATATGLSVEKMSRNVLLSGMLGNSLLNAYLLIVTNPALVLRIIAFLVFTIIISIIILYCCKKIFS